MIKLATNIPCEILDILEQIDNNNTNVLLKENMKGRGSHGTVYKLSEQYCLKFFKNVHYCQKELEVLQKIQDKSYAPKLYAYNENKYILIEWIDGYNLIEYLREFNRLPYSIVKDLYETKIDLIKSGINNCDIKLDEHLLWLKNNCTSFKLIDYGVCDTFDIEELINYLVKSEKEQYDLIMSNDKAKRDEFRHRLLYCAVPNELIDDLFKNI